MAANIRNRGFFAQVQGTGTPTAPAHVRNRGFVGTVASGVAPVTGAARVRNRGFSGTVVTGTVTPSNPAHIRNRGFSGKVYPNGTPAPGKVRTGRWAKRAGVWVPVRVYSAAEIHAIDGGP
jgi:hypothetical protein